MTADWRLDADYPLLKEYAGEPLPNGSGLSVSLVENGNSYMPDRLSQTFSKTKINNISNFSSGVSTHANNVGYRYCGNNLSLTPAIDTVNVFNTNDFLFGTIKFASNVELSSDKVMNHAYVFSSFSLTITQKLLARFDYFSQESSILNVVGLNNGSNTSVPPGWSTSYNSISVGRTDGNHSSGGTPRNLESPGRLKPDIVANESTTSWATGAVSSASCLLIDKGTQQSNPDTIHPDTIKAVLMTGATKSEFPQWNQTTTNPLDPKFGAGEINILRSYRIIEEPESTSGAVHYRGWARGSVSYTSKEVQTYTFTTSTTQSSPKLSATLIWQRPVSENSGTYTYQDLANLKLELLDSLGNILQTSDSAIDNVEHIWNPTLAPGTTYTLRVSSTSDSSNFSLAWTVAGKNKMDATLTHEANSNRITFKKLIVKTDYQIQRSTNLIDWSTVQSFTATESTRHYIDESPPENGTTAYRLKFFHP